MAITEVFTALIIIIAALLFLFALLFILADWFNAFAIEQKYINAELERASGEERKYWKRKKIRLWLSVLPFVRYK